MIRSLEKMITTLSKQESLLLCSNDLTFSSLVIYFDSHIVYSTRLKLFHQWCWCFTTYDLCSRTWKGYSVKRGPDYAPRRRRTATDLTREHLQGYAPICTWICRYSVDHKYELLSAICFVCSTMKCVGVC